MSQWPPEKLDAQTVDNQHWMPFQFLGSLHPVGRGWSANNSPEPALIALLVPHSRLTDSAARLSFCRWLFCTYERLVAFDPPS
jgi:hypothetical protein